MPASAMLSTLSASVKITIQNGTSVAFNSQITDITAKKLFNNNFLGLKVELQSLFLTTPEIALFWKSNKNGRAVS